MKNKLTLSILFMSLLLSSCGQVDPSVIDWKNFSYYYEFSEFTEDSLTKPKQYESAYIELYEYSSSYVLSYKITQDEPETIQLVSEYGYWHKTEDQTNIVSDFQFTITNERLVKTTNPYLKAYFTAFRGGLNVKIYNGETVQTEFKMKDCDRKLPNYVSESQYFVRSFGSSKVSKEKIVNTFRGSRMYYDGIDKVYFTKRETYATGVGSFVKFEGTLFDTTEEEYSTTNGQTGETTYMKKLVINKRTQYVYGEEKNTTTDIDMTLAFYPIENDSKISLLNREEGWSLQYMTDSASRFYTDPTFDL